MNHCPKEMLEIIYKDALKIFSGFRMLSNRLNWCFAIAMYICSRACRKLFGGIESPEEDLSGWAHGVPGVRCQAF